MNDKGNIEMRFPDTYWLLGSTIEQDTLTTYQVEGIVPIREVTQLAMGRVHGRSRTFEINVVDRAQLSNDVDTRFELVYSTSNGDRPRNRYHIQYEGPVSPDLIQQDRNRFTLALGRLPLSSQLLSGGTNAHIQLKVIRSYGNNSAEQTLTWTGRI